MAQFTAIDRERGERISVLNERFESSCKNRSDSSSDGIGCRTVCTEKFE